MPRRAKIVCTLGPSSSSQEAVFGLVRAGMDVARLNLSHGSYKDHEQVYLNVRRASDETGRSVAVLVDLQGPKIRLGKFDGGAATLAEGERFVITTDDVVGDARRASTTYAGLATDIAVGDPILVDDGRLSLTVTAVEGNDVITEVVIGGRVSDHKGMNLPRTEIAAPALTDKDAADLKWALDLRADLIALSFVRGPDDVQSVRRVMAEHGVQLPVLAKLEKPQAVEQLEEVVEAFDGLMVARGDLGVEMRLDEVPTVQKRAVALARGQAKPVIVATQMLESMVSEERPTRAEASDVANAVLDGVDAVMLSAETSVGKHPVRVVETMGTVVATTERNGADLVRDLAKDPFTMGGVIAKAAIEVGTLLGASALCAFTQTGDTARRLARHHSPIALLAFTPVQAVRSQLSLSWGVETFLTEMVEHTDEMVRQVDVALLEAGRCAIGERVVIVAGSPPGTPGSTNALRVHRIGDAVGGVAPAYRNQRRRRA
ncbi:MAG: pyruvate kinase [Streptosporangiales bacterium]|nr:pyruvate kinase [Streptosporangiales bacterium]